MVRVSKEALDTPKGLVRGPRRASKNLSEGREQFGGVPACGVASLSRPQTSLLLSAPSGVLCAAETSGTSSAVVCAHADG